MSLLHQLIEYQVISMRSCHINSNLDPTTDIIDEGLWEKKPSLIERNDWIQQILLSGLQTKLEAEEGGSSEGEWKLDGGRQGIKLGDGVWRRTEEGGWEDKQKNGGGEESERDSMGATADWLIGKKGKGGVRERERRGAVGCVRAWANAQSATAATRRVYFQSPPNLAFAPLSYLLHPHFLTPFPICALSLTRDMSSSHAPSSFLLLHPPCPCHRPPSCSNYLCHRDDGCQRSQEKPAPERSKAWINNHAVMLMFEWSGTNQRVSAKFVYVCHTNLMTEHYSVSPLVSVQESFRLFLFFLYEKTEWNYNRKWKLEMDIMSLKRLMAALQLKVNILA